MRYKCLLISVIALVFFSCKKEKTTMIPEVPGQEVPPVISPVLLKDITIPHLPSPYYHFEYNLDGKPGFLSYASGLSMYNFLYNGNRLLEMKNNILVNKDRLQYSYDNDGRISTVLYADSTGAVYKRIFFTYEAQKLIKMEREGKSGPGFIIEKIVTFTYYADGNLKELTERRPFLIPGQSSANFVEQFENYDDAINVENFSLLHNEFFDHVLFLPGVQFQKNNPLNFTHTGDDVNYQVDYRYVYNNKNAIKIIFPRNSYYPGEILKGFKNFCRDYCRINFI